jgi:soluble lytic murein transglycosylase-like protein
MALWLLSVIMILSMLAFSPYNSQMYLSRRDEALSLQYPMLPAFFPEKLVAFDPLNKLINTPIQDPDHLFNLIIQEAATRYRVDSAMVKAIISAESSYNIWAVSSKGAKGLMQLMPVTAKELGVENSFNPVQNIYAGVKYFKMMLNRFDGDVKLALAAYNAGIGRVKEFKGVPPFRETKYYIKKVMEYHRYYRAKADMDVIKRWQ